MVADHWFRQVERVLEAMEITSDATRIRLATFKLEGESQIWWDWTKVSRDLETMTWGEFHELFMSKFFPASARHAKAWEFLELKQGGMTVLEYVARFTELARFKDDYMATDMAKVRKFEDGLKLSIRGKIVGFLIQDMNSMIRTAMAIEREIEDAWSIRDAGTSGKRKESQTSFSSGKKPKASGSRGFQGQGRNYQGQGHTKTPSQSESVTCFHCHQLCETGLPSEAGIPGLWDTSVLVINGTCTDAICSFLPQCGPEGPVSISGCCTSAFCYTEGPKRPKYGSRSRTGLTSRDFRDPGACLRHRTAD